ncbi:MAG: hypothetical protein ACREOP_09090 [Thermodesulfobacteriota bacterium]
MRLDRRAMLLLAAVPVIIISGIYFISCDSAVNGCFGVNLEGSSCVAEDILAIGQEDGLGCYKCTGQETGDHFSIAWSEGPIEGTPNPGTIFSILNTTGKWIAEFTDCGTLTLFETFQNEFGRFVKGDFAGTLQDIDPFQIDKLSLTIDIPGVRTEEAVCNFCADSTPPQCFETIPYL